MALEPGGAPLARRASRPSHGYDFTPQLRRALATARAEAGRLHDASVDTQHLLLGLLSDPEGPTARVLARLGANLDALRAAAEGATPHDESTSASSDLPYSTRAKKVLELAMSEASDLDHGQVDVAHLLLGLLREDKGIAARILGAAGVSADAVRSALPARGARDRFARPGPRGLVALTDDGAIVSAGRGAGAGFTRRVRCVLASAREEASLAHGAVSPEHIAAALLRERDGMAGAMLERLRADHGLLARQLGGAAASSRASSEASTSGGYAPEAKRVLALAVHEMQEAGDAVVGTDHLLLGLLRDARSDAARLLAEAGVTLDAARAAHERLRG
jgi:ATP-dependent Clp protease ATP-binding subunit ClpA